MENLNLVELLRDCPKGMELDCTMFDNAYFERVNENNVDFPIRIKVGKTDVINLTKYGCWNKYSNAKCVIFPKGKTTWEGFQRPFKDGEILATNNGKYIAIIKKNGGKYYCCCHTNGTYLVIDESGWFDRLATEEEKAKLFQAIKDNGYKWNPETKTLEKLVVPKFKVGDRIKKGEKNAIVERVYKDSYDIRFDIDSCIGAFTIDLQDEWELVPNKFDITTLKAFDKVLYRMHHNDTWFAGFYNVCIKNKIFVIGLSAAPYCIPYENNQHLLGTTNDCEDFYKTWEK